MKHVLILLVLLPFAALGQETDSVRDLFKKPPEGVEYNDEYVEELIEVERPVSHSEPRPIAVLRGLDKVSGLVTDVRVPVGQTVAYERLMLTVSECREPPEDEPEDAFAFVRITDAREGGGEVFAGWMFASSPALSAMDHQRYDLWVLSCATS